MSTSPAPRKPQPCTKASGWGQLSCLEAKLCNTESIKMLAASSNKAGTFRPPCFAQSFPGSRLWLCKPTQLEVSLQILMWTLVLHFPRCPKHEDSWDWRGKPFFHRFHTMRHGAFRQISPKTGLSINMEIQNKLSRHQQQLITKPHSSWDLNSLLYAQRERERNWRKLAITQFYFPPSLFTVHQVALHSHTKGACEH